MNQSQTPLTIGLVTMEYVTESNFDGGLSNYLHRLAVSLQQLGHQPIVIVFGGDKDEIITHKGIEVHRLRFRGAKILTMLNFLTIKKIPTSIYQIWSGFWVSLKIREIHRLKKFSLLHYPSCCAMGIFRLRNVPALIRISSYMPLWNQAYELPRSLDIRLCEQLEKFANTQADGLCAPSILNGKTVEQVVHRQVKIIETPFILENVELNYSVYEANLKDKKYLLFFGTIGLMKGCGLIRDIIYTLLNNNPDLYFVFVGKDKGFFGFQDKSVMEEIKEKAAENNDRVIHFDRLGHDFLYPIIANAFAVVLPSRVDNFPNTCLEAMGHKKVVIGTRGTSFEQLIDSGVSGFLCEKDNPEDLLAKIEEVLKLSTSEKQAIEAKAEERIQQLRPEKVVNQLVDFYRQIISEF